MRSECGSEKWAAYDKMLETQKVKEAHNPCHLSLAATKQQLVQSARKPNTMTIDCTCLPRATSPMSVLPRDFRWPRAGHFQSFPVPVWTAIRPLSLHGMTTQYSSILGPALSRPQFCEGMTVPSSGKADPGGLISIADQPGVVSVGVADRLSQVFAVWRHYWLPVIHLRGISEGREQDRWNND